MAAIKVTFLGTGVSHGIPVIGCGCKVCRSKNPRDRRLRSSIHVECGGWHIQVDTPPDFREQSLKFRLPRVDALFFTHAHADHIFGLDDVRRFNEIQGGVIPVYASAETGKVLRDCFGYTLRPPPPGLSVPYLELCEERWPVSLGEVTVHPLPVQHGKMQACGFMFASAETRVAYIPDCSGIPDSTLAMIQGCDAIALDALRPEPHPSHFSLDESVDHLLRIGAKQSWITHLCHLLGHEETGQMLPGGIQVAYDGMVWEVGR